MICVFFSFLLALKGYAAVSWWQCSEPFLLFWLRWIITPPPVWSTYSHGFFLKYSCVQVSPEWSYTSSLLKSVSVKFASCRPSWRCLCKTWQVECSCQAPRKQRSTSYTWWVGPESLKHENQVLPVICYQTSLLLISTRNVMFNFHHARPGASVQIEDGEIYASINQKDGMVCFHDNPEKYNNPAMLHKIDQEVRSAPLFSVLSCFAWSLIIMLFMNPDRMFGGNWSCIIFLLSDVEMYRAGWETKVYGSRNHSKPTICAEGEAMFNSINYTDINDFSSVVSTCLVRHLQYFSHSAKVLYMW